MPSGVRIVERDLVEHLRNRYAQANLQTDIVFSKVYLPDNQKPLYLVASWLPGSEDPLILLTTMVVENLEQAKQIIWYYKQRWVCEEASQFLKSRVGLECFRIRRYEVRRGSGGEGRYRSGNGINREIEFWENSQVTILSERRRLKPYGLSGGEPGLSGSIILIRDGEERELSGKVSCEVEAGDIICLQTPSGGGYGEGSKRR